MSSSLATAFITLVPKCDTSKLKKEGDEAGHKFGNSFSGRLKTAALVGGAAIASAMAGVVASTAALNNALQSVADYGDNVDKMSQKSASARNPIKSGHMSWKEPELPLTIYSPA